MEKVELELMKMFEQVKLSNPKIVTTSNLVLVWLDWNSIQAAKQAKHKNSAFSTNLYTCLGFLLCVNVFTYVLNLVFIAFLALLCHTSFDLLRTSMGSDINDTKSTIYCFNFQLFDIILFVSLF